MPWPLPTIWGGSSWGVGLGPVAIAQATPPAPKTTAPAQPNTQAPAATPPEQTTLARPWPPQTPAPPGLLEHQAVHPASRAQSNGAFSTAPSRSGRSSPIHGRSTGALANAPSARNPAVPLDHRDRTGNLA